ncbi:MAG: hypothetical protein J5I41_08150 [Saprospiraceae bacterium]|nr:hypothetical protein [Saprospiraceae bacterium]
MSPSLPPGMDAWWLDRWPEGLTPWQAWPDTAGRTDLAWLVPLWRLAPEEVRGEWIIAALSSRVPAPCRLSVDPADADPSRLLLLREKARVAGGDLARQYLADVRPDLDFVGEAPSRLCLWPDGPPEGALIRELHVREFPPPAGSGVWAWVCRRDAENLRRFLAPVHRPETARITNVERELQSRFRMAGCPSVGLHVEEDAEGFMHLWMAWSPDPSSPLRRAAVSTTSPLGLADLAWAKTGLTFVSPLTQNPT